MEKTDAEIRAEIIRTLERMDRERLEKLHIFALGLLAARQRDAPDERREETHEGGEQSGAD